MFIDQIEKLKEYQFSEPFQNWLSSLLFLPLALYFRFIIGTSLVLDKDFTTLSRTIWILGLVFLSWLVLKWIFDDRLIITGLEIYLAVFFLISCISTFLSVNKSLSSEKLIGIFAYLFGTYFLLDLKRFSRLWNGLINALLVTAGLSSLLILISAIPWIKLYQLTPVEILTNPTYFLKGIPRLPYSLGFHQSVTAGYLVLILPLAVYQFFNSKKIFWKALQIIGLILNLAVLVLTQSRGGLLGLFFLALLFILLYRVEIWKFITNNKIIGSFLIAGLVAVGFGVLYLIGKSRGFNFGTGTIQMRFNQWDVAFRIIQDNPLFGSGLGTFGQKYLDLRDPLFFPGTYIHAHNQLIQITTELGILGSISLLILTWQGIRLLRKERGKLPPSSKAAFIALGGLFGVLIPDAILTSSMIVLLLLFYLVWLFPTEEHLPYLKNTKGTGLISLAGFLLVCSAGWILWKIQPYDIALQEAKQQNWQGASTALHSALERDPGNPYYVHSLAYSEGQIACKTRENVNQAVKYYQESFDTYRNWGIDHANAAVLYAIKGDYHNAAIQMEWAYQNYPQNSTFSCLLGDYYYQFNRTGDAVASYVRCISGSPQLLNSPFWQEDQNRKGLIPEVITLVETNLRNKMDDESVMLLAELYMAVDDLDKADEIIQDYLVENPTDLEGNVIYLKIQESRNELSDGKKIIEELLLSNPRKADLWFFKAKLAQQEGNEKDAEFAYTLGYRLQPSLEKSWVMGHYYQSQGDLEKAQDLFQYALDTIPSPMLDFSRRVAGRWPIGGEYLNCMPVIRTYHGFFDPALNAANDLEKEDCTLAACIYQRLESLNPGIKEARIQLESLPCLEDFDPKYCFIHQDE